MGLSNVEFRKGIIEDMPIEDGWADVVISNGVIYLCADKGPSLAKFFACYGRAAGCNSPT